MPLHTHPLVEQRHILCVCVSLLFSGVLQVWQGGDPSQRNAIDFGLSLGSGPVLLLPVVTGGSVGVALVRRYFPFGHLDCSLVGQFVAHYSGVTFHFPQVYCTMEGAHFLGY